MKYDLVLRTSYYHSKKGHLSPVFFPLFYNNIKYVIEENKFLWFPNNSERFF